MTRCKIETDKINVSQEQHKTFTLQSKWEPLVFEFWTLFIYFKANKERHKQVKTIHSPKRKLQ